LSPRRRKDSWILYTLWKKSAKYPFKSREGSSYSGLVVKRVSGKRHGKKLMDKG
jgi:hypothetical protein